MLAEKLKKLRTRNNLQQKDLVEYLKIAKSTYSQYESGKSNPDYETLKMIAVFYNVSIDYLLGKEDRSFTKQNEIVYENLEYDTFILYKKIMNATPQQLKIIKAVLEEDEEEIKKE